MRELNATELRSDLTHICDDIMRRGDGWVITRYGKALAIILPYEKKTVEAFDASKRKPSAF